MFFLFFSQHGESMYNLNGKIGGDSDLSEHGWKYAEVLNDFVQTQRIHDLKVWTSWMKRTIQTASHIEAPQERWKALNEIDAVLIQLSIYDHWVHSLIWLHSGNLRGDDVRRYCGGASGRIQKPRPGQVPLSLSSWRIVRGSGGPFGTGHHGTGAAEECPGHRSPGRHSLPPRLLSQQNRW